MNRKCPWYDSCEVPQTQRDNRPNWIEGVCESSSHNKYNQCEIYVDRKATETRLILEKGGGPKEIKEFLIELGELS